MTICEEVALIGLDKSEKIGHWNRQIAYRLLSACKIAGIPDVELTEGHNMFWVGRTQSQASGSDDPNKRNVDENPKNNRKSP